MSGDALAVELLEARDRFHATLAAIAPESLATPGLVGEWSARELVAHLGYWAGHAAEVIHAVVEGRADEVGTDEPPTDEVNATVARIARQTDVATVRKREAASVEALAEQLRALDPALLQSPLPGGDTLEEAVREDGPDHYREHAEELEAILAERPHG